MYSTYLDLWAALGVLLLVTAPALGQDESRLRSEPWQPEIAVHMCGTHGLTGFGSMVDGRIPSPFFAVPQTGGPLGAYSTRFGLHYAFRARSRDVQGMSTRYERWDQYQTLTATYGLTVQGVDATIGLPYRAEVERLLVMRAPDPDPHRDRGVGDLRFGAKVAFRIPNFFLEEWAIAALAPYVLARVPSGDSSLRGPVQVEYGVAIAGPFGYSFRYNANLAVYQEEGGLTGLAYRIGASAVPLADSELVLRVYGHLDGIEYEGRPYSRIDLELGAQLLLGGFLTLDLGLSLRLLGAGFAERPLRRSLRDSFGDRVVRIQDEGAFSVTFGFGFVL